MIKEKYALSAFLIMCWGAFISMDIPTPMIVAATITCFVLCFGLLSKDKP